MQTLTRNILQQWRVPRCNHLDRYTTVKVTFFQTRIVISCPNNDALLQPMDHIIVLVQFEDEDKEKVEQDKKKVEQDKEI